MINRNTLFSSLRQSLFGEHLSELQVEGIEHIINEWEKDETNTDIRQLAYILATIYHETSKTMQPVKEYGGEIYLKSKKYYPYYGRDLCQTTWNYNYEKVKHFTGIDVVAEPDLIGQMPLAAQVCIYFMKHGLYTGKKLSDYFDEKRADPLGARRIINGTDAAAKIVAYYLNFLKALEIKKAAE